MLLSREHPAGCSSEVGHGSSMRLTYFHYLSNGDTALNHVRQFVGAAESAGHEVDVCSLESVELPSSHQLSLQQKLFGLLKRHLRFYLHEPKKIWSNLPSYRIAASALDRQQPDAVLVRNELLSLGAIVAAKRHGFPLVLEVNSPAVESRQYLDQYLHLPRLPEAVELKQLTLADGITVVSDSLRAHFLERYGLQPEKFTIVPNGADLSRFRPDSLPDPDLAIAVGEAITVGFVGSFEKWHGPGLLCDMVLRVAAARPESQFLLVGDGPGRKAVEEKLDSLAHRVILTGRVPHNRIPGIVACMDIGVQPESAFYQSPLKVIEWMAAGRAIVAPDYGPLREVIESGREGLLFNPGNAEDLVAAVVKLIDDPGLRQRLGQSAHRRATDSLSWSHNAARVMEACQRAIESRSRRAQQRR